MRRVREAVAASRGSRSAVHLRSVATSNRNRESRVAARHESKGLQRQKRRVPLETQGRERRARRRVRRGVQDARRRQGRLRAGPERIAESETRSAISCQKTGSEKIGQTFCAQKKLIARGAAFPPVGLLPCARRPSSYRAGDSGGISHRRPLSARLRAGSRSFRPTPPVPWKLFAGVRYAGMIGRGTT